jgi:hypothetical protein
VHRRALLAALAGGLGGCAGVLPRERRPPAEARWQAPNLFVDLHPVGDDELEATVTAGNRLTAENTEAVTLRDGIETVTWVHRAKPARQDFPLEPGDSIRVPRPPAGERVAVVWSAEDRSKRVAEYERPAPTATETAGDGGGGT